MLQYDEKSSLVGTFRYPFFGRDYFRTTLYENDLLGRSLVDSFFATTLQRFTVHWQSFKSRRGQFRTAKNIPFLSNL